MNGADEQLNKFITLYYSEFMTNIW